MSSPTFEFPLHEHSESSPGDSFSLREKNAWVGSFIKNAEALFSQEQSKSANVLINDVLKSEPENIDALRIKIDLLKKESDLEAALEIALQVASRSRDVLDELHVADLHYDLGHFEQAIDGYLKVLPHLEYEKDRLFKVYKNLGNLFLRTGDIDSAEENYNRAFAINPQSDALMVNYGTLFIQKQNMQEALERFRAAVKMNELNEKAWIGLALVHRNYGDFELAWGNLLSALDVDAANEVAIRLLIEWGFKDQKWDYLVRTLPAFIALRPKEAFAQDAYEYARKILGHTLR